MAVLDNQPLPALAVPPAAATAPMPRIPRIIHYVWVGPKPMPAKDAAFVEGWKRLMPDWEFRFWNNETVDIGSSRWLKGAYAMKGWNKISDYMRLWALREHGGIYLDTDIELLKPLDQLLHHRCFLGLQADERGRDWRNYDEWVNGAVIGAEPGHWFPRECFDTLMRVQGWQSTGSWTGPGLVTEVLARHGLKGPSQELAEYDGVTVFPTRYFYPYAHGAELTPACVRPDTVAIHHWAATWTGEAKRWPLSKKIMMRVARVSPSLAYRLRRHQLDRKPA